MKRIELPDHPDSIRRARQFVRDVLADHCIEAWEPVVVVSELAANVIMHARTDFSVAVDVTGDQVRVEVEDGAAATLVAIKLDTDAGGQGLRLVESLATEWGVEDRAGGKAVWVTMPVP